MDQSFSDESSVHKNSPGRRPSIPSARNFLLRVSTRGSSYSMSETLHSDIHTTQNRIPETDLADIARVQLCGSEETASPTTVDTRRYQWWLCQQISSIPAQVFSALTLYDHEKRAEALTLLWKAVIGYLSVNEDATIDQLVDHLSRQEMLEKQSDHNAQKSAKSLVFSILGWQTMLFRADCGSCPTSCLAIAEETSNHHSRTHLKLRSLDSASKKPLHKCLVGFGVLLPPRNCNLSAVAEHKKAFNDIRDISCSDLNAAILTRVGGIEIRWTSSLACHLEFDTAANCLYLFRYPSFCIANRTNGTAGTPRYSSIYACAQSGPSDALWATKSEVSEFLEEILMSYRLLFGQHKESRNLFRSLEPFEAIPNHAHDKVLTELCGRKHCHVSLTRADRKHWDLKQDFPILRSRLSTLAYEMSIRKPRTWSEMWNDKRDCPQWATFWTVLILGATGLLLSLLQVILQTIQIVQNR